MADFIMSNGAPIFGSGLAQATILETCPGNERGLISWRMSSTKTVKDCLAAFKLQPVEERPNISVICFETPRSPRVTRQRDKGRRTGMTAEDWDKFEKDIAEAFEQVP
jgi:hypothetical protein